MSALLERLTRQLASRGVKGAKNVAIGLLRERGHMEKDSTKLTKEGKKREDLGNGGRAIDREIKKKGGKPSDYKYNSHTNKAKKK